MSDSLPKITVITATFNLIKDGREQFFRQCVESVHNQTYSNIEHLVMDGASTDGSLDLIKEYEEKGWLKCYSEPDEGMWEGMDKGLKKANGKYICFLNSDDYYQSNDILEKAIRKLEETGADYLYGDLNVTKKEGDFNIYLPTLSLEYFFKQMPINHEALVVKREVYERLGWYDLSYKTTIDYAFVCKLIMNDCSFVYLNESFLTVRLGGGTTQNNGVPRDVVVNTVIRLYQDLYSSFYQLSDKECYEMFVHNVFKEDFLRALQRYLVKKNFHNFNYSFFGKIIDKYLKQKNDASSENIQKGKKRKMVYVFGIPMFRINVSKFKEKYLLFNFLPLLATRIKSNTKRYELFGFIPFMKKKIK